MHISEMRQVTAGLNAVRVAWQPAPCPQQIASWHEACSAAHLHRRWLPHQRLHQAHQEAHCCPLLVPLLTATSCAASRGSLASTQPPADRLPAALQLADGLQHHQPQLAGRPAAAELRQHQLPPGLLPGQQQTWRYCRHATGGSQGARLGLLQRLRLHCCQAPTPLRLHLRAF